MRHITQAQLKRVDMTFVLFKVLFTRDEPRIKFGLIVLMRSMWFDVVRWVRCVRCGSMCSMSSMSSMLCGKIYRKLSSI